jgi:hypothetical protein
MEERMDWARRMFRDLVDRQLARYFNSAMNPLAAARRLWGSPPR